MEKRRETKRTQEIKKEEGREGDGKDWLTQEEEGGGDWRGRSGWVDV